VKFLKDTAGAMQKSQDCRWR